MADFEVNTGTPGSFPDIIAPGDPEYDEITRRCERSPDSLGFESSVSFGHHVFFVDFGMAPGRRKPPKPTLGRAFADVSATTILGVVSLDSFANSEVFAGTGFALVDAAFIGITALRYMRSR